MTESSQGPSEERREPFVSEGDRPEMELNLDTPLSELRLRDLRDILGGGLVRKEDLDQHKPLKSWKFEKYEKFEIGIKEFIKDKPEKFELKESWMKELTKFEKNEKLEIEIDIKRDPEPGPDPTTLPDPRLAQVIQTVSGLGNQVNQLADQVAELQRRLQG